MKLLQLPLNDQHAAIRQKKIPISHRLFVLVTVCRGGDRTCVSLMSFYLVSKCCGCCFFVCDLLVFALVRRLVEHQRELCVSYEPWEKKFPSVVCYNCQEKQREECQYRAVTVLYGVWRNTRKQKWLRSCGSAFVLVFRRVRHYL